MGAKSSKEVLKMPSARKVLAARTRAPAEAPATGAVDSSAAMGGRVKVVERGGSNIVENEGKQAVTDDKILSEMSKWHFIDSKEDEAIKRLVQEKRANMASLIRMQASDEALPGRNVPVGLMNVDELDRLLLSLRDTTDGQTLREARMVFLSELEALGVDEETAINIATYAKMPLVQVEDEDVFVAR